jgi:hypothetical protein
LSGTNEGAQMSSEWIEYTIRRMQRSPDANVKNTGDILRQNIDNIEKYVLTVDKDLKQIIIMKLDNF